MKIENIGVRIRKFMVTVDIVYLFRGYKRINKQNVQELSTKFI